MKYTFLQKGAILLTFLIISFCSGYSNAQSSWMQKNNFPGTARNSVATFVIGSKAYMVCGDVGLTQAGANPTTDFWVYDYCSDTWTQLPDFPGAARSGSFAFTLNGKGYVGCGWAGWGTFFTDFYQYDPNTSKWTQLGNFGGLGRENAVCFVIDNVPYVGTGFTSALNSSGDFWKYNVSTDTWTQLGVFPGGYRRDAVAFAINGQGYMVGGYNGSCFGDVWQYDPGTDTWTKKGNFPTGGRHVATGFAIGNYGYFGTGADCIGGVLNDFWRYDPTNDSWLQVATVSPNGRYSDAGFVIGCKGFVGLGTSSVGANETDMWALTDASNPVACVTQISVSGATICPGQSATLNPNGTTSGTFTWSPSTGLSCTNCPSPVANPTVTTPYILQDSTSCGSGTDTVIVTVLPNPSAGHIVALSDTICAGTEASLFLYDDSGFVQLQYSDSLLSGFYDIGDTAGYFTIVLNRTTTFWLIASNGGCTDTSAEFTIYVSPSPVVAFTDTVSGDAVSFFVEAGSNVASYFWDFGDSTYSTWQNPVHIYDTTGVYNVCLAVRNATNCDYITCQSVSIFPTGIKEVSATDNLNIYPNPFENEITVSTGNITGRIQNVEIYDVLGRRVFNNSAPASSSNLLHLDVSNLEAGMYFLRTTINGVDYNQKMIKQ